MSKDKKTEDQTSQAIPEQQKTPIDPNLNSAVMAINETAITMNKSYELIYNQLALAIRENQQLIAKDKASQVRIKELSKKVIKKKS